jgi:uncharacterized repeat protein (TIGR03803 family)
MSLTASIAQCTAIFNFSGTNGSDPQGSLTLSGKKLFGMTTNGGTNGKGCVFFIDTTGNGHKDILDFNGTNGANPVYGKLLLLGTKLYGMTQKGGANNSGCLFLIDTNGTGYTDLHDFTNSTGSAPDGSVIFVGKLLYGTASAGGANNDGCIFSIDSNGSGYRDLYDFTGTKGQTPTGDLTVLSKHLYGTAEYGGAQTNGCIFSIDTNGSNFKDILDFGDQSAPLGANPTGSLVLSGSTLFGLASAGGIADLGCGFSLDTNGSNYKEVIDFTNTKGYFPFGNPTTIGNKMYGMVSNGFNNKGCIFSADTNGSGFNVLVDFSTTTFGAPMGSFTMSGHNFYGYTTAGGTGSDGVIFKFNYITAGIDEISNSDNGAKLFPNPNKGQFVIQFANKSISSALISIYNELGQEVYSRKSSGIDGKYEIDLGDNKITGLYFYRIISEQGDIISHEKFIIE